MPSTPPAPAVHIQQAIWQVPRLLPLSRLYLVVLVIDDRPDHILYAFVGNRRWVELEDGLGHVLMRRCATEAKKGEYPE